MSQACLALFCFAFFINGGEISLKGDEEWVLSNENGEPFPDRWELKCINTQRWMQNEHSNKHAWKRKTVINHQGGLFVTGRSANFG